jgi:hypothetical protein
VRLKVLQQSHLLLPCRAAVRLRVLLLVHMLLPRRASVRLGVLLLGQSSTLVLSCMQLPGLRWICAQGWA